jgi:hypothetical protein
MPQPPHCLSTAAGPSDAYASPGVGGWPAPTWAPAWDVHAAAPSQPVKGHPTIAPGELGPDPVLDAYAQGRFGGDLQACDDLFFESPPMSAYEEYAATCGIRVTQFAVMVCTDLE